MVIRGIGYEGRSLESLVERIAGSGVELVIDVREVPWSRKPGLSKTKLAETLMQAGIAYLHLRSAGNPRAIRRSARSVDDCLRRYRDHLLGNDDCLKEIHELASEKQVALLCYEAEATSCHRSIIAEALIARDPDVEFADL